jgi:hypothetical protein
MALVRLTHDPETFEPTIIISSKIQLSQIMETTDQLEPVSIQELTNIYSKEFYNALSNFINLQKA